MSPILLDDSIVGEHENFLLYGEGGTGKTFASGTMPGPVYHLIAGATSELITLRSPNFLDKYPEKKTHYYDVIFENIGKRGIFISADGYDEACDKLDEAMDLNKAGDLQFKSIVIDATGLSDYAMNKSIEATAGRASQKLVDEGMMIPGDLDYKGEMSLMRKYLDWVVGLPYHVCVITHEWVAEKTDPKDHRSKSLISVRPLFTGKNREGIPRMFSNVWRMSTEGKGKGQIFQAQTTRDDIVYARTRFGGLLPTQLRDPDLTQVIEMFKKEVSNRTKEKAS